MKKIMKGLRSLSKISDEKEFPNIKILTFLAKTTNPDSYFPNYYLYDFELKRITFTTLGTLAKTGEDTESKFLLAMFFIYRILIRDILMNPQNVYVGQQLNNKEVQ